MTKEDYFKYYIQGSDHYLIPRDIFEELFNEMNNWKNEYKRREKKWEKWATEKGILSSKMGEYLCKYQNIKREYANQNKFLCEYKKENQRLKEEITKLKEPTTYFKYASKSVVDENKQLKEVIEEVREVINKMIHTGYVASNGDDYSATQYMATNEHSEFGIRAKVLLQILDKVKEK